MPQAGKHLLLIVLLVLLPWKALAQPPIEPDNDELRSGLVGSYSDGSGHTFQRVDAQIAAGWQQAPPDRRLAAGPYRVRWHGYLMSQARGEYRLSIHAAGKVKVSLGDQTVIEAASAEPAWMHSEPLDLPFDWHRLEIQYSSPADAGDIHLFWSGPGFSLEPVSPRQLFHEPADSPANDFERGRQLVRALRCSACHAIPGEADPLAAPALTHLHGNISPAWMVEWLTAAREPSPGRLVRRMPHFKLTKSEAEAVTAYLLAESQPPEALEKSVKLPKGAKEPHADDGRRLVNSRGCLACHEIGGLGRGELFGGGDLSAIAAKRPADFFRQWLTAPESLNADHRMPVYSLSEEELGHVTAYLQTLGKTTRSPKFDQTLLVLGKTLVEKHQCGACHALPGGQSPAGEGRAAALANDSAWENSCTAEASGANRPHYQLAPEDRQAIESFLRQLAPQQAPLPVTGEQLLVERNCLSCHERDGSHGLASLLPEIGKAHEELNEILPALQPPTLTSVGDKLTDAALHKAIRRESGVHRSWLEVQMPKFRLSDEQERAIVDHLIAADRIPAGHGMQLVAAAPESEEVLRLAGKRLVTSTGFGCTSCHAVGEVEPPKGPLDAKGPNLLMLQDRIRRQWFDRWVRNPARIVPRMEMPSVQLATPGVLDDSLDSQLAAVWEVLNLKDFRPPEPGPVRVVRASGVPERKERASVLTDVLNLGETQFVKPLLVGLPNRHNAVFDLAHGRLAAWWIGDTAEQRTRGKTWFWTAGGESLLMPPSTEPELVLMIGAKEFRPIRRGQFITTLNGWQHDKHDTVTFAYQLTFADVYGNEHVAVIEETWHPLGVEANSTETGFARRISVKQLPAGARLKIVPAKPATEQAHIIGHQPTSNAATPSPNEFAESVDGQADFSLNYLTTLPVDRFPQEIPQVGLPEPTPITTVPGFHATQLSLPTDVMPTALAWASNGDIYLASLKGRVWHGRATADDGKSFDWSVFSDELAAPYGIAVGEGYVDVLNKYALLRLEDHDNHGFAESTRVLAAGWGHTADYHDWAVGLERDGEGNYYAAIPCEQDGRPTEAARWRGRVLRIDSATGAITEVSGGHRFPMGLARNRAGEMFVTDNQGNYNPFNELNHVLSGKRYGFLNSTEKKLKDFNPELTPPAIDIPHPWTRSVNGICFLETPESLRGKENAPLFGPFEGHLVGCEYDTRRLIRLSLDHVAGGIQGAAYPLSIVPTASDQERLLGPINCAVSPGGDLYIANIRDSGWGGGNNIGSLVQMRFDAASLPIGIREVRAEPRALRVEFTAPLDARRLADVNNYAVSSYTRISTPAYGGDDHDRRREAVKRVEVSKDRTSVALKFDELRADYVYEVRVSGLIENDAKFHPAEAHYTMRRTP